jgi:hypothetical protein
MGGYVSRGANGTTELRVHGVSGTPPAEMLDHPNVVQVAGDGTAGFYRRWWPVRPDRLEDDDADSDDMRQEGYSWGALTAGSRVRALWLLLLPFMLANIAFFMIPSSLAGSRKWDPVWWFRKSSEAFQRVFSLGLTLILVLTAVSVSMDMVTGQCTRPGSQGCSGICVLARLPYRGVLHSAESAAGPGRAGAAGRDRRALVAQPEHVVEL